jgi:hypothetical protein
MSVQEHHREAERLLEKARTARGQANRSELLAEAQVHATLALSAAPETTVSVPGISKQDVAPPPAPRNRALNAVAGNDPSFVNPRDGPSSIHLPSARRNRRSTGTLKSAERPVRRGT